MAEAPRPARSSSSPSDQVRLWQIAAGVLALLVFTLLITTIALRSRADSAGDKQLAAERRTAELESANTELSQRNKQLYTQLSASNERLVELVGEVNVPASYKDVTEPQVSRAVAAQENAGSAAARERAQLRNAQICSATSLRALFLIHGGADIESGSDKAAALVATAAPSCNAALR